MRFIYNLEKRCIVKVQSSVSRQVEYQEEIKKRNIVIKALYQLNKQNPSILFELYSKCH